MELTRNKIESYQDLLVWQKAVDLVTRVYDVTKDYPKEEIYALTSQIRRSAVSIPSNIAEGYGRHSTKDYVYFLKIARGSLFELETQMIISKNLEYIGDMIIEKVFDNIVEIKKMLNGLIRSIRQ